MTNYKKRNIIIIIAVFLAIALRIAVICLISLGIFVGTFRSIYSSKPDNSGDELIPKGYISTDSQQWAGGGDWEQSSYFVYDETPEFDECFEEITIENAKIVKELLMMCFKTKIGNKNIDSIVSCVSSGDCYHIANYVYRDHSDNEICGGLIYYYDTQENTLYKIDFCS